MENQRSHGFGTAPVFFTAISTILGAILFLRFGYAVGTLGFTGVIAIILLGHLVTIPTALAISEIATNQRVEGGGEYFIISRSFGLNIGATIGLALFLSQAISIAFYVIAFTEAFEPFFEWMRSVHGIDLPRQAISLPAMAILTALILIRGANMGVKALIVIVIILVGSLALFFAGTTEYASEEVYSLMSDSFRNSGQFFIVFFFRFLYCLCHLLPCIYRNDSRCGIIGGFKITSEIHTQGNPDGHIYWHDRLYFYRMEADCFGKPC